MSFFTQHFAQRVANNEADDDDGEYVEDDMMSRLVEEHLVASLWGKLEQQMRLNAALESVSAVSVTVFISWH